MMVLHSDAVAKDCPTRVGTARIDRNYADSFLLLSIVFGKLIDQRALAGAGCPRQAENSSVTGVME